MSFRNYDQLELHHFKASVMVPLQCLYGYAVVAVKVEGNTALLDLSEWLWCLIGLDENSDSARHIGCTKIVTL